MEFGTFAVRYTRVALALFHALVFFALLNAALGAVFFVRDRYKKPENRIIAQYGMELVRKAYPGKSDEEIRALLDDTWSRPFAYDSYTGFKEREWKSANVNVDAKGFRLVKDQAAWPPDPNNFNVLFFGGSTTFGYGVADDETAASYFQELARDVGNKNVVVYNFGRGLYISGQERALFEKLLAGGFRPDVAVFVDGVNDYHLEPKVWQGVIDAFEGKAEAGMLSRLPVTRLIDSLRRRLSGASSPALTAAPAEESSRASETIAIADNYLRNKKLTEAAAAAYGVTALFVWQPIPVYHYDLQYHIFKDFAAHDFDGSLSAEAYEQMADRMVSGATGRNFIWAADIQEGIKRPLYVDFVHYNPELHRMLAQFIIDVMNAAKMLPRS